MEDKVTARVGELIFNIVFSTLQNHQKQLYKDLVCLTSVEGLTTSVEGLTTSVEGLTTSVEGLGTFVECPLFRRKNLDNETSRGYHNDPGLCG